MSIVPQLLQSILAGPPQSKGCACSDRSQPSEGERISFHSHRKRVRLRSSGNTGCLLLEVRRVRSLPSLYVPASTNTLPLLLLAFGPWTHITRNSVFDLPLQLDHCSLSTVPPLGTSCFSQELITGDIPPAIAPVFQVYDDPPRAGLGSEKYAQIGSSLPYLNPENP